MTLFTTERFASMAASGTDWRDVSKKVLEELGSIRTDGDGFNLGFIYITDSLASDAGSILALFRSITGIQHWVGTVGLGICTTGQSFVDEPALVIMVGRFDSESFRVFPAVDLDITPAKTILEPWLEAVEPLLSLIHANPLSEPDPLTIMRQLERIGGAFFVGGLSSSRTELVQFSGDTVEYGGVSGVMFDQSVPIVTAIMQGCAPIGPLHTITRCVDHTIRELDGRRAFDIFSEDIRALAKKYTGKEPGKVLLEQGSSPEPEKKSSESDFHGEIHIAFPVRGSDMEDYLVRNILDVNPEEGLLTVTQPVANGEHVMFVHRDRNTAQADLSRTLLDLRERVHKEYGEFSPKGALYISCVARIPPDNRKEAAEMALVKEVLGAIPLAGFYANGEISNRRLYGYTAILILFL